MTSQSVEDVCRALEIDPDTLEPAAKFVADRKTFARNLRSVQTSTSLPNGESVHLHQCVSDGQQDYCVTNVSADSVTLTEINVPVEARTPSFGQSTTVTYGALCMDYELVTTIDDATPEFAY